MRIRKTGATGVVERVFERHQKWGGGTRCRVKIHDGPGTGLTLTLAPRELDHVEKDTEQ